MPDLSTSTPAPTPTIVGRVHEQNEMRAALDRARSGRGSLLWLAGEPGIGKSTLAESLRAQAAANDMPVLWATSWQGDGAPSFWPWLQVLRQLAESAGTAAIERAFGPVADELGPFASELGLERSPDAIDRFQAFDGLAAGFGHLARDRPTVIVLEDLHWADTASLELFRFIVQDLRTVPLIVLATYRDVEIGRDHPLAGILGRVGSDPIHLQLAPLDRSEVRELLALTIGGAPPPGLTDVVVAGAGGNPFFVRELARLMTDRDTSRPVPSNVRQVVMDRVSRLPTGAADLLRASTAVGVVFTLSDLVLLTGRSPAASIDDLQAAIDSRIIEVVDEAEHRYRFVHAIVQEVLYADLPPGRRAELHLALAKEADRTDHDDSRRAERALHWARAVPIVGPQPAFDAAIVAAADAMTQLAYEDAAAHLERAVALQRQLDHEHPRAGAGPRAELLLELGRAQQLTHDRPTIHATRREIARWARVAKRPDLIGLAALVLAVPFVGISPETEELEMLEDALDGLPVVDSGLRACVMARMAAHLVFSVDEARRDALATEAVAMARRLGEPRALRYALIEQASITWQNPETAPRLAMTNEVIALAEISTDRDVALHARLARLGTLLMAGDGRTFRVELDAFDRIATRSRRLIYSRITPLLRATVAQFEGRFDDAEALISSAMREAEQLSDPSALLGVDASWAALRTVQGRAVELSDSLTAATREYPSSSSYLAACALVDAIRGDVDSGRMRAGHIARNAFGDVPRDHLWLTAVFDTVLAAVVIGMPTVARWGHEQLLPYRDLVVMASRTGVACLGPVAMALGQAAELNGQIDLAIGHYEHGIVVADRLDAMIFRADISWALARALRRRGTADDLARAAQLEAKAGVVGVAMGVRFPLNGVQPNVAEPAASAEHADRAGHAGVSAASTSATSAVPSLRRDDDFWTFERDGESVRVRHGVGIEHLARLVEAPGQERHVLDLVAGGAPGQRSPARIEVLDDQAKQAYRQRIAELQAALDDADAAGHAVRSERIQTELDSLVDELRRSVGLGGRDRAVSDANERARVAVTKALRASIRRIAERSPRLGAHFEETVRTGTFCSYEGDAAWAVDR